MLVTAEDTPWVHFIAERLEIEEVILGAKDRLEGLHKVSRLYGVSLEQI